MCCGESLALWRADDSQHLASVVFLGCRCHNVPFAVNGLSAFVNHASGRVNMLAVQLPTEVCWGLISPLWADSGHCYAKTGRRRSGQSPSSGLPALNNAWREISAECHLALKAPRNQRDFRSNWKSELRYI
jgi:hypothetical protein